MLQDTLNETIGKDVRKDIIEAWDTNNYRNKIAPKIDGGFEWLNEEGKSTLRLLTLDEAIIKFLDTYKTDVAPSSYKRIVTIYCNSF